jgi:hypothetical protein
MRARVADTLRRLPGGSDVLRVRREMRAAIRGRRDRDRPPYGSPEKVADFSRAPASERFITGNGIAARCRYVINYDDVTVNENVRNDWWFCKADYLEYFFAEHAPRDPFVLFSHNSDRAIGKRFRRELRRRALVAWFAQNPLLEHPKLHALPIGIANPRWPHGDQAELARVQDAQLPKSALFDASFDAGTNPVERQYCLQQTRLELAPRVPFPQYLERLASAFFCISPNGNGIDCVRTWEALYLRTIPIVTRSRITDDHHDLPLIVLDDWSQFGSLDFSPKLYERTIGAWSADALRLDRYLERVERIIAVARP